MRAILSIAAGGVHLEVLRRALRREPPAPAQRQVLALELLASGVGDEHLIGAGCGRHARGHVDVDAEEVVPELARPADVDPRAQARPRPADLDAGERLARLER